MGQENERKNETGDGGPQPFSLRRRLQSFRFALNGGRILVATQHNAWMHGLATVVVVIVAAGVEVSRLEWALLLLAMGLVWAMEALNTAVELLADEVSLEQRPRLGRAKDVAAFGVLVGAAAAVLIGLLVFLPHFLP